MNNNEMIIELALTHFSDSKFSQVAGYGHWLVLSDRFYGDNKGRVVIVNQLGWLFEPIQFELVGEERNFLGENIWISGDG